MWGKNQALGPSPFGAGGAQLGALMESMGQLREAGLDANGCLITPHDECREGKGTFESATGAEDPEGVRTGLRGGDS